MKEFIDPNLLDRLRVGPLAAYLDTYLKRIEHAGFLSSSAPVQMYAIARFSNWLHSRQVNLRLMDEGTIVDKTLIALWLEHESTETTQIYLDANLRMKEEALSKVAPIKTKAGRYQPDDKLLAFLKSL